MDPRLHTLFLEHIEKDIDVSVLTNELDDSSLARREDVEDENIPRKITPEEKDRLRSIISFGTYSELSEYCSHKIDFGTMELILEFLKHRHWDGSVWSLLYFAIGQYKFNLEKVLDAMELFLTPHYFDCPDMWAVRRRIVGILQTEVKIKELKLAKRYHYEFPMSSYIWSHWVGIALMLGDQVMLGELKFACDIIELDPHNSFAWQLRSFMVVNIQIERECLFEKEFTFLDQMLSKDPWIKDAWSYREHLAFLTRNKLEHQNTEHSNICIKEFYTKELQFVTSVLLKFVDSGGAWAYREWIVDAAMFNIEEEMCDIEEELDFTYRILLEDRYNKYAWPWRSYVFKSFIKKPTPQELDFVSRFLIENDEKNQCAWNYRQWLLLELGGWEDEIEFCNGLLSEDITNECAWSQKRFVLGNCGSGERLKKMRGEEVQFAIQTIHKKPESGYLWSYLRELYQKTETECDDADIDGVLETILLNEVESECPSTEVIINALDTILDMVCKNYRVNQKIGVLIRVLCWRLSCCGVEDDARSGADGIWNDASLILQCLDPIYEFSWKERLERTGYVHW